MFNIGTPELILILVLALIIFGPKKLPEMGKAIGNGLREFRKATNDLQNSLTGINDSDPKVTKVTEEEAKSPESLF